jgi:hypothetical protein
MNRTIDKLVLRLLEVSILSTLSTKCSRISCFFKKQKQIIIGLEEGSYLTPASILTFFFFSKRNIVLRRPQSDVLLPRQTCICRKLNWDVMVTFQRKQTRDVPGTWTEDLARKQTLKEKQEMIY